MKEGSFSLTIVVPLVVASVLVFGGVWLHYTDIFTMGIEGADESFYWLMATRWLRGELLLSEHFRPFIYLFDSWALGALGINDWAIQLVHSTCNVMAGFFLVLVARIWLGNWLPGVVSAAVYLTLARPLEWSKSAAVHGPTALFVVASVFAFSLSYQFVGRRLICYFLSGLFLGFAWLSHPDLAVLGAVFVLAIMVRERSLVNAIKPAMIFVAGYLCLLLIFLGIFGFVDIGASFLKTHHAQSASADGFLYKLAFFSYHYIRYNTGHLWLWLYLACLLFVFTKWLCRVRYSLEILLVFLPASYMFFCALLFARTLIPRLFVPMTPILVLAVIGVGFQILKKRPNIRMILLTGLMVVSVVFQYEKLKSHRSESESMYRVIHRELGGKVKANKKLLLGPISVYHIHEPMKTGLYLQGHAEYLPKLYEPSLKEVVEQHQIKYVLVAKRLRDLRVFGKNFKPSYRERLETLLKIPYEDWTPELEVNRFLELLGPFQPKLIWSGEIGDVYELRT